MHATDVEKYASAVQDAYGEDAREFARKMAARFAGTETEVELFWQTVEQSLAAEAPSSEPAPSSPPARNGPQLRQIAANATSLLREALTPETGSTRRFVPRIAAGAST